LKRGHWKYWLDAL